MTARESWPGARPAGVLGAAPFEDGAQLARGTGCLSQAPWQAATARHLAGRSWGRQRAWAADLAAAARCQRLRWERPRRGPGGRRGQAAAGARRAEPQAPVGGGGGRPAGAPVRVPAAQEAAAGRALARRRAREAAGIGEIPGGSAGDEHASDLGRLASEADARLDNPKALDAGNLRLAGRRPNRRQLVQTRGRRAGHIAFQQAPAAPEGGFGSGRRRQSGLADWRRPPAGGRVPTHALAGTVAPPAASCTPPLAATVTPSGNVSSPLATTVSPPGNVTSPMATTLPAERQRHLAAGDHDDVAGGDDRARLRLALHAWRHR